MSQYTEDLKTANTTAVITPSPLIMNSVGEKFRGLYVGMKSFDKVDPNTGALTSMPVAHFFDGTGLVFNMGAQLTRAIAMIKPGTSVEITLKELKSNKHSGKTKIYSIAPLDIPKVDLEEMFGGVLAIGDPAPEHLLPAPVAPANGDWENN